MSTFITSGHPVGSAIKRRSAMVVWPPDAEIGSATTFRKMGWCWQLWCAFVDVRAKEHTFESWFGSTIININANKSVLLPSNRQHLSSDDCVEDYYNDSALLSTTLMHTSSYSYEQFLLVNCACWFVFKLYMF